MFFPYIIFNMSPILYGSVENDSTPQWNNSYYVVVNKTLE